MPIFFEILERAPLAFFSFSLPVFPPTFMAALDEAAFTGDAFEPAAWLRDLCARRPPGEALDR